MAGVNGSAASARKVRVVLADDHAIFRDGLRRLFAADPGVEVVGEAGDGEEAVELARALRPDLVLLDLAMPGTGGFEALPALAALDPPPAIVVLTASTDAKEMTRALELGARAFVSKVSAAEVVVDAIRAVMAGGYWVGREPAADLEAALRGIWPGPAARSPAKFRLTRRELEVVGAILEGGTNADIAGRLGISEDTVKHHLTNLYDKTGVSSRLELAIFALDNRLGKG